MRRFDAWTVHLSTWLVAGTGLVYAWLRYLVEPEDPFAVVNHPWQPTFQHLHLWLAPLLVFGAGLIWRQHVWDHWRCGKRSGRRSGLAMMLTLAPMVVSGYLIQTAVGAGWRTAWVAVHLATSGLWILGYAAHAVTVYRRRRRRERERAPAQPAATASPAASAAGGDGATHLR